MVRSGRSSFSQAHTKSTAWSQQSIKKASTLLVYDARRAGEKVRESA